MMLESAGSAGCTDSASESKHCKKSNGERRRATRKIADVLEEIPLPAGLTFDTLDTRLETCARTCEACDAGVKQRNKERACLELLHWSPLDFAQPGLPARFFAVGNPVTEPLACPPAPDNAAPTSQCVKSSSAYGLLSPLQDVTFRNSGVTEFAYTPDANPLPLVELMSPAFAMEVSGDVRVFVSDRDEVSLLAEELRRLSAFNFGVTSVSIEVVMADADASEVQRQRALTGVAAAVSDLRDDWRSSCSTTARQFLAPISVKLYEG